MQCPSCGAPFDWHSKFAEVITCESCQGVCRIHGDSVTLTGQSAKLIQSSSGLGLGVTGSYQNVAFAIVGRVRYGYPKGFWDEWCAHTMEGDLIWLTEDDGTLTKSRSRKLRKQTSDLDKVGLGRSIFIADHDYLVEEIGEAKCLGTEGQLPFSAMPGDVIQYIGLRAGRTQTGTIERYDDEVHFYEGRRVKLSELNLLNPVSQGPTGPTAGFEIATPDPKQLGCFSCGAPVLPVHGQALSPCHFCGIENPTNLPQVSCGECGTRFGIYGAQYMSQAQCPKCLHGVHIETQGTGEELKIYTKAAESTPKPAELHQKGIKPFKLGQRCNFDGKTFVLTGHLRNEVVEDGLSYYSDSYHLLSEDGEVRWLDTEENHYVLSERIGPVPERLLNMLPKTKTVIHGREYQAFDSGESSICCVQGQFSYSASVNDTSSYYDFVAPPYHLSAELSGQELEGFAGRYIPINELAQAFSMSESSFREPETVGPSQPFIETELGQLVRTKLPFYVLFFFLTMVITNGAGTLLYEDQYNYDHGATASGHTTKRFDISDTPTTLSLDLDTNVDNSWVYIDVELFDEYDNLIHGAAETISYYHGYEGGESWSEGSRDHEFLFRVNTPGSYRVRLTTEGNRSASVRLKVQDGVYLSRFPLMGFIVTALWWFFNFLRRKTFEGSRWRHLQEDDE